ncbi:hypothetical protein [Sphingobium yanoikuyae]|uniref:hypothetical protein n=1 Tax=Sphingobium yanoikuyae TaxID=13690 RepID=UPI00068C03FA|nr:hypothetical protein [Sphingobium yanoikuyae]
MTETIAHDEIRSQLAASVGGEAQLASWFSNRTFSDLRARAARLLDEAAADAVTMIEKVNRAIDKEGLREWHGSTDADLARRYVRFWAAWQRAGSQTANWMITGPANFPVKRNQKRIATEDRRWEELNAFRTQAPARAIKRAQRIRKAAIGATGMMDSELADLQDRHAERVARQAMMKAVNALIRKHKLAEEGDGPARLAAMAREANHAIGEKLALELLKPDCFGIRGFASFQLSNNNAEIRRLAGRIAQVQAKLARAEAVESGEAENRTRTVGSVEIVENAAEDRLQILFPGKPDGETRYALKRHGFRWSPSQGAWQRQLTNAARYAAEQVVARLPESEA